MSKDKITITATEDDWISLMSLCMEANRMETLSIQRRFKEFNVEKTEFGRWESRIAQQILNHHERREKEKHGKRQARRAVQTRSHHGHQE